MVNISYCVTVADEVMEFERLIEFLISHKQIGDNILVLVDSNKVNIGLEKILLEYEKDSKILKHYRNFGGNFAEWKNYFFQHNSFKKNLKDYLFFIDADELPNPKLIDDIPYILYVNPDVDVFGVPRINFVEGITPEYVSSMGWYKDKNNRINYPDYQYRICKNNDVLRWGGKVHETIQGYKIRTELPQNDQYDLLHVKSFEKQIKQNKFYESIQRIISNNQD